VYDDLIPALNTAIADAEPNSLIVLSGSLYLIGHFLAQVDIKE
jgi:folylpolyglutamate synthase/dihydropteroate synthase